MMNIDRIEYKTKELQNELDQLKNDFKESERIHNAKSDHALGLTDL